MRAQKRSTTKQRNPFGQYKQCSVDNILLCRITCNNGMLSEGLGLVKEGGKHGQLERRQDSV